MVNENNNYFFDDQNQKLLMLKINFTSFGNKKKNRQSTMLLFISSVANCALSPLQWHNSSRDAKPCPFVNVILMYTFVKLYISDGYVWSSGYAREKKFETKRTNTSNDLGNTSSNWPIHWIIIICAII